MDIAKNGEPKVITVPLDQVQDRLSPLALRGVFGEDGIKVSIVGNASFRNLIGERAYRDFLLSHTDPYIRQQAELIDVPEPSLRDRVVNKARKLAVRHR